MELNTKRYVYMLMGVGVFLFLLPILVSFISFSDKSKIAGDWAIPCMFLSVNLPLMTGDKPRRFRIRLLLYSMLPLFGCVFAGYIFLAAISDYTFDWLRGFVSLAVMAPIGLSVGLFVIWLTSQPTPKQMMDKEEQ